MPRGGRESLRRTASFTHDANDAVKSRSMRRSHTLASGALTTGHRVSHTFSHAEELPSHVQQIIAAQKALSDALMDLEEYRCSRSRRRNGSDYTSRRLACQASTCDQNPTTLAHPTSERSPSPGCCDAGGCGLSADEGTDATATETDVTDDEEASSHVSIAHRIHEDQRGIIKSSGSAETPLQPFPFNLELNAEQLDSLVEEVFIALNAASSELAETLASMPSIALCRDILDRAYETYTRAHLAFQAAKDYDYSINLHDKVVSRLSFLQSIRSRLSGAVDIDDGGTQPMTPPVSAIRAYFEQESARLANKLPSTRPMLDQLAEGISAAVHDAGHFVQEEGEKLVELVTDEAEKLKEALRLGAQRLLTYSELPAAWRNNKHIVGSYRFIPADKPWRLIRSAFLWHNETINIHSHFIPSLAIIWYIFAIFPTTALGNAQDNTLLDRGISLLFLLAALSCLSLSAAWHTASGCATWSVFHGCATLDYNGVVALISSSIITLTHQAFRCTPRQNLLYNTITCLFGALGLWLPWRPWFNEREYKNIRIAFFVALAAGGMAPVVHVAAVYGTSEALDFFSPVAYSLLAYIVGLTLYVSDFPERLAPGGLFDTLFHSHQAWHVCIVIAIALHWSAITKMAEKGLTGLSCADSDPYTAQQLFSQLRHWHSEP